MRNVLTNVLGARETVDVHVMERTLSSRRHAAALHRRPARRARAGHAPGDPRAARTTSTPFRRRWSIWRSRRARATTSPRWSCATRPTDDIGRHDARRRAARIRSAGTAIVERIGRGAMGVVYAAIDEQLDRRVAVKLMLSDFDEEPELRERFYREARITGQLAHRNIVTVFDLGDHQGRPYIVMELLNGLPLAGSPAAARGAGRRRQDRSDDAGLRRAAERASAAASSTAISSPATCSCSAAAC